MSGDIGTARTAPEAAPGLGPALASLPDSTSWVALDPLPEVVADARSYTNSVLGAWNVPDDGIDNTVLVVSELVTNAIQAPAAHPAAKVWLRLSHRPGQVCVEVADGSAGSPQRRRPEPVGDDEHGRGLLIVELLCERWDCYQLTGAGKVVIAMISTRQARP